MNERQPQSLEQLKSRETRLSRVIGQRQELYPAIGTGRIREGDSTASTIKVGRVKSKVLESTRKAQASLTFVQEEITNFGETLISQAQEHLDKVAVFREQLKEIRTYVSQGHIRPEILEKHEAEFRQLAAQPGTNPQLKQGIELLKERKRKEVAQAPEEAEAEKEDTKTAPVPKVEKPVAPVEPEAGERAILPDGQDVTDNLPPLEKKLVIGLKPASDENPITRDELIRFVYGDDIPLEASIPRFYNLISESRKKLERFGWGISNKTTNKEMAQGKKSQYYLQPKPAMIEEKEGAKIVPPEEEIKKFPVIKVDSAARKVQVEGWEQSKQIGGKIDWAVFQCLVESLQRGEPLAQTQQLEKAAWEAGSKDENVATQAVYRLRRILEPDPFNPQLIIRSSSLVRINEAIFPNWKIGGYRLNAQVQFVGGPQKVEPAPTVPKKEEKAITLEEIDGKIAIIIKAVATGAMPQSELDEALRIRATFIDGAKTPETEILPKMKIDEASRNVAIDGRVVQFREGLTFGSLLHIARLSNKQISSSELKKFMEENGSKDNPGDLIYKIKETLEIDAKHPQILKSLRSKEFGGVIYRLAADIEFTAPEEEPKVRPRRLRESREIPLPDGQIVHTSGYRRQTLEFFLDSPDLTALPDDVSLALFGSTDAKFRNRTISSISDLNTSILEQRGWHFKNLTSRQDSIRGQKARYRLEKINPDIIKAELEQSPALAPSMERTTDTEKGLTDNLSIETTDFAEKLARARDLAKEGFISPEDLAQLEEDLLREKIIVPAVETAPRNIEEYDPAIKEDINLYLELIAKLRIWPINGQQLLQISPSLTWTFVSSLIDKEIVSQNNLNGRPMFTKGEVAVMLYAWEHGILPAKTHLVELQELIKKEIAEKNKGGKDD